MRRIFCFLLFAFLLTACSSQIGNQPAQTATLAPTVTLTLAVPTVATTLAPTATFLPKETPAPPTIKPISTFTPTFDARTIVTVTPAPKAECPSKNPDIAPNFDLTQKGILDFLNKGGDVSFVINKARTYLSLEVWEIRYQDVNADTVPEVIFIDATANNDSGQLIILACSDNRFVSFLPTPDSSNQSGVSWPIDLYTIADINKNGILEIVVTYRGCSGSGCFGFYTYEWNGKEYKNTTPFVEEIWGLKNINFQDIDNNGVDEILLAGDRPGICCEKDYIPWRLKIAVYTWNGTIFSENYFYFDLPHYRFQAIQDGDREMYFEHYSKAELAYKAAIFSSQLGWWSEEKWSYLVIPYRYDDHTPFGPTPIPDITEYPRLAAYAYYRMVILHIHLDQMDAAQLKYTTLQEKFPAGSPGHPYAEMATAFWNAYQSSQKMYDACAAAIAYADTHPEILVPLGSDYHGWQSHTYEPADVCPFR